LSTRKANCFVRAFKSSGVIDYNLQFEIYHPQLFL
jgi:hypothetical protein